MTRQKSWQAVRFRQLLAGSLALTLLLGLATPLQAQCAMCKSALTSQEDPEDVNRLSRGFYYSILTMMGIPTVLVGGLVGLVVVNNRSRRDPTKH
jgi:hypothetical protein